MRDLDGEGTRERFLAAIADRLPAEAVVEVHLFQPIRQSGFESGVAVIAVEEQQSTGGEAAAENRLAIHTAHYRLTQKGPERGKWEFDIQADADAPLVTVDKVVRGVQRRSGDAEDPERLSGDDFRALLPPREPAEGPSA
jgi:hypothetical protein